MMKSSIAVKLTKSIAMAVPQIKVSRQSHLKKHHKNKEPKQVKTELIKQSQLLKTLIEDPSVIEVEVQPMGLIYDVIYVSHHEPEPPQPEPQPYWKCYQKL
jgi:hypothetical protein